MGQYYTPYVKQGKKEIKFDNKVDGDYNGLKLMEHSWWLNCYVGQVVNQIFYKKGNVAWVGDYYDENNYAQVNCNKEEVERIGELVWNKNSSLKETASHTRKARTLSDCLLVNHTKKLFINGNKYFKENKTVETWNGKDYDCCVHPLPLLTCSANHSGGSYYGINKDLCGTWFNDVLEVVFDWEEGKLIGKGYIEFEPKFREE